MMSPVLKALFSSQTRVKLLATFLLNPDKEFFIRELTRLLGEQINSVCRELENLHKIGFVRARSKLRKKYYKVNTDFHLYEELRSIFAKEIQTDQSLVGKLKNISGAELILLAGSFVGSDGDVDLLLVGPIKKEVLEALLLQEGGKKIKYSIFSRADFLYRVSLNDRFIMQILSDPRHLIVHNTIQEEIEEAQRGN